MGCEHTGLQARWQERGDTGQMIRGRQLAANHARPEVAGQVVEHRVDRLARDVRAWRAFAKALGAGVVPHANDHGVGAAPLARAVAEPLDEGDAKGVQRRVDEPHRAAPTAVESLK